MKIGVDFSFWPPQREGMWRRGGLMVSALDSGSGGPGSSVSAFRQEDLEAESMQMVFLLRDTLFTPSLSLLSLLL